MNPFPGLRPFTDKYLPYYTGREIFSNILETRTRISSFTLLYARSGLGKSSFLTCRLIPLLRNKSRTIYLNEWGAENPADSIKRSIRAIRSEKPDDVELPVLILDQFEDVFKFTENRTNLWEEMAEITNTRFPDCHVLISMREEWLGAFEEARDYLPNAFNSTLRLSPLRENEIVNAIKKPLEHSGIEFSGELIDKIIADIQKPNEFGLGKAYVELGHMQLVCSRIWQEAAYNEVSTVDVRFYDEYLGGAERIIKEFVWNKLKGGKQAQAKFEIADKILWTGLTRHLVFEPGIKTTVTAQKLAKKLLFKDLGVAGLAVLVNKKVPWERKYLETEGTERPEPNDKLVDVILGVLDKAVGVGFLKRQGENGETDQAVGNIARRYSYYELVHDSLGPILQEFSLEFDKVARRKLLALKIAAGVMACLLVVLLPAVEKFLKADPEFFKLPSDYLDYLQVLMVIILIYFSLKIIGFLSKKSIMLLSMLASPFILDQAESSFPDIKKRLKYGNPVKNDFGNKVRSGLSYSSDLLKDVLSTFGKWFVLPIGLIKGLILKIMGKKSGRTQEAAKEKADL